MISGYAIPIGFGYGSTMPPTSAFGKPGLAFAAAVSEDGPSVPVDPLSLSSLLSQGFDEGAAPLARTKIDAEVELRVRNMVTPKWLALGSGNQGQTLRANSWWFHFDPYPFEQVCGGPLFSGLASSGKNEGKTEEH